MKFREIWSAVGPHQRNAFVPFSLSSASCPGTDMKERRMLVMYFPPHAPLPAFCLWAINKTQNFQQLFISGTLPNPPVFTCCFCLCEFTDFSDNKFEMTRHIKQVDSALGILVCWAGLSPAKTVSFKVAKPKCLCGCHFWRPGLL